MGRPCMPTTETTASPEEEARASLNAFNQLKTRNRSGGGLPNLATTFNYDDIGNTLSESTVSPAVTTTYSWDRDNRLRAVTPPAPGVPTSYSHDANGLRVQRVDATGTTRYLLDRDSVLTELDGANAVTTRYVNNPQHLDDIIGFERGGATYYPLTDALGSIYAVTDSSGAAARRYDFDVYGVRTDLGGSSPSVDVGHAGRWHDANGLIEHRARLRQSQLGGWLQPDALGHIGGPSLYAALGNSPAMKTDALGYIAMDSFHALAFTNLPAFLMLLLDLGESYSTIIFLAQAISAVGAQVEDYRAAMNIAAECTDVAAAARRGEIKTYYKGLSTVDLKELTGDGIVKSRLLRWHTDTTIDSAAKVATASRSPGSGYLVRVATNRRGAIGGSGEQERLFFWTLGGWPGEFLSAPHR